MSKESLPEMHYMSEHERVKVHPAVIRCISIASVPSNFPFNLPLSADRQYRGPRFTIGWLEFQSPDQPDPNVARPGDVWVQLPSGNRKARVYVCYSTKGKVWSPWAGNNISLAARGSVPTHPFLNDHPQRKFYLIFNGSQFTWANPKAISNIMHANRQLSKMSPAEAAIKWLKETGVGRTSASPVETDVHSTSVQQVNRKRAHPDQSEPPGDLVSEPAEKKTRDSLSFQQTNETSPNARPVVILQLPYQRPQVQGGAASAAQPRVMHKALEQQTLHMRIPSASFVPLSGHADVRSGSPLMCDEAAVEKMLDSPTGMNAAPRLDTAGTSGLEAQGGVTAEAEEAGSDKDKDEDFVRFIEMTLEGIAHVHEGIAHAQEGLRGMLATMGRNSKTNLPN